MNETRCKGCIGLDATDEERVIICKDCIEAEDIEEVEDPVAYEESYDECVKSRPISELWKEWGIDFG